MRTVVVKAGQALGRFSQAHAPAQFIVEYDEDSYGWEFIVYLRADRKR